MEQRKFMTTLERGRFKESIHRALYRSEDIRELLLGDTSGMSTDELQQNFKKHVKSHLFIDDTITEAAAFIYYDVTCPLLTTNMKQCQVNLYAICHRDILDDYEKLGYFGNRADVLSEMVEGALLNDKMVANEFGIGELTLDMVDIYNSQYFYGVNMIFSDPNFRWR